MYEVQFCPSEWEHPRDEKTSDHEVHHRERRANLDKVREFVAAGPPHKRVRLVPNGCDEGPRGSQQYGHDERLVAHLSEERGNKHENPRDKERGVT